MKVRKLHAPRRVFIGIKLADHLRDAVVDLQSAFGELPGNFIPPQDFHLTLVPPFETRDLSFTESTLHRALGRTRQFTLHLLRVEYAPDKERPRLAWIQCDATEELILLKKKLLKAFACKEKVPFIPHMTLARFKKADAESVAHHSIERPVGLTMEVASVELFESPRRGGVGYRVLSSVQLQPKEESPF